MSEQSWQLAHFSQQLPSGDYRFMQQPAGANWRTRVIIPLDEKIVAVQVTEDAQRYWYLPGGGVEGAETLVDCAVREVQEETHLDVRIERLLYVREYVTIPSIEFYLLGTYLAGELARGYDPELDTIQFDAVDAIPLERIENDPGLTFYPSTLRKRLRYDLHNPPTTALYWGEVP